MTKFPWKLFLNDVEIVFPKGARRFVDVSVRPIAQSGSLRRTIDGAGVWTGYSGFDLNEVSLNCTDQTVAPISDLWPGTRVVFESPDEFSVPGPTASLKHRPVDGQVYGVDAGDRVVGRREGVVDVVSIPGAVALRYRPVLECYVTDRTFDGNRRRAEAGWSLVLQECGPGFDSEEGENPGDGGDGGTGEAVDRVYIAPVAAQNLPFGGSFSVPVTATATGPVDWSVVSPAQGPFITAQGVLSWDRVPTGLHAVVVRATSGQASDDQTVAVAAASASLTFAPLGVVQDTPGSSYESDLSSSVTTNAGAVTFSLITPPVDASITASGLFSFNGMPAGIHEIVVQAAAGGLQARQTLVFVVSVANTAEYMRLRDPGVANLGEGDELSFQFGPYLDTANIASVSWSIVGTNPGASIDSQGNLTWSDVPRGVNTVSVQVASGALAEVQTLVVVRNVAAQPFLRLADLPLRSLAAGGSVSFSLADYVSTNTDAPLTYAAFNAPSGFTLSAEGSVTWSGIDAGVYELQLRVSAPSIGLSDMQTLVVHSIGEEDPGNGGGGGTDYIRLADIGLQIVAAGDYYTLELSPTVSTNLVGTPEFTTTAAFDDFLMTSDGIVEWYDVPAGVYAFPVTVSLGGLSDTQTVVIHATGEVDAELSKWAQISSIQSGIYTDELGQNWSAHFIDGDESVSFTRAGLVFPLLIGGGGSGGEALGEEDSAGGGGGAGQVLKFENPVYVEEGSQFITIGLGGIGSIGGGIGAPGSPTIALGFKAAGGGGGGSSTAAPQPGYASGGGGGAGFDAATDGAPGFLDLVEDGGRGSYGLFGGEFYAGGGGGALGSAFESSGGGGSFIDRHGIYLEFAGGGGGATNSTMEGVGSAGRGGGRGARPVGQAQNGTDGTGGGGGGGLLGSGPGRGGNGRVILFVRV